MVQRSLEQVSFLDKHYCPISGCYICIKFDMQRLFQLCNSGTRFLVEQVNPLSAGLTNVLMTGC